MDNKKGCYIKLLDSNDTNISNLALGYTIKDIQLSDNYIILSIHFISNAH